MYAFSQLCESIAATTKKLEKIQLVADYFRSLHGELDNEALGALYLCGRVFPRREERVLSVGFSVILRAVSAISGKEPHSLAPTLRHHGDIGAGAEEILAEQSAPSGMRLTDIADVYDALARQRGPTGKQALFEEALRKLSALEAKYFIKICTGELRIGLKESLVEEGIARCYEQPSAIVQRANMLTGDISETLRLAAEGRLAGLQIELFRPISVMLASPVDTAAELVEVFPNGTLVEEKFDGIRAQIHKRGETVEMYSRTLDRVTEFPELAGPLRKVPGDFILDGEIIGWRDGRAIPFTELQQRL
jgi:DNA ligase-1